MSKAPPSQEGEWLVYTSLNCTVQTSQSQVHRPLGVWFCSSVIKPVFETTLYSVSALFELAIRMPSLCTSWMLAFRMVILVEREAGMLQHLPPISMPRQPLLASTLSISTSWTL